MLGLVVNFLFMSKLMEQVMDLSPTVTFYFVGYRGWKYFSITFRLNKIEPESFLQQNYELSQVFFFCQKVWSIDRNFCGGKLNNVFRKIRHDLSLGFNIFKSKIFFSPQLLLSGWSAINPCNEELGGCSPCDDFGACKDGLVPLCDGSFE